MKRLIAIVALSATLLSQAQIAELGSPQPILAGTYTGLYNPILSADGTKLLFSGADYSGLRLYDFGSGATTLVSTEANAGFDARFSADGSEIVYIAQRAADNGRLTRSLRTYDIERGATSTVIDNARTIISPVTDNGAVDIKADGKRRTVGRIPAVSVRTEGSTLFISRAGKEKAYTPVANSAGYIWASLSPKADKVMFFAAGHGIVICDLNGNIISEPGNFEAPVWYNNDIIVAMNATDDGHQYRSSQIILLSADGKMRQEATRPESMTMFPTASAASGKIVYSTIDGRLYQMSVSLSNDK